jgi:hypothetical protein
MGFFLRAALGGVAMVALIGAPGCSCGSTDATCKVGCFGGGGASSESAQGGGNTGGANGGGGGATASGGAGGGGQAPTCNPAHETCACDAGTCDAGLDCVGGLCILGCDFSYQCPNGKVCDDGACVEACTMPGDCGAGMTCKKGVCVVDEANPECSGDKPCKGSGDACAGGLCEQRCTATTDCKSGEVCDAKSGTCIPDPSRQIFCSDQMPCAGAGQMCGADGYCYYACMTATDCQLVDVFFTVCQMGVCMTDAEANPECTMAMPCPAGKDCISNKCL